MNRRTIGPGIECWLGDCLPLMAEIEPGSVDLVLCDLPYGTTQNEWDAVIPFKELWSAYRSVCKPTAVIALTCSQPFTSALVMSNLPDFRYCLVWDRVNKYTDALNAKRRPMRRHEDIAVFSPSSQSTYNPQMTTVRPYRARMMKPTETGSYGVVNVPRNYGEAITEHNPCSVIEIKAQFTGSTLHPTQKPVPLFEYLTRTFSNEGDLVLDNCMGSGTTGIACFNTGRRFLGIEKDQTYFNVACARIAEATAQPALFAAE